jgi:regulator of nonsense transcripts 3
MTTPQLLRKTNGHQSVASSQSGADAVAKTSKAKAPVEGEKVVIRRLPPGLTEDEFQTILGDTWKSGNGKIGWYRYEKGKISTE